MHEDPTIGSEGGDDDIDDPPMAPGVDVHMYETEWAAAWEDVPSSPLESLPVLDELVGRMLETAGYHGDDTVAAEGDERELHDRYQAVHDALQDDEIGDDPGDIADAINSLTEVYEALRAQLTGSSEI
jgi:hypothetical protein